jgi:outer membrane usher protein
LGSHGGEEGITSFRSSNFSGINATLDTRLIAPLGVLDNSAIIGMTLATKPKPASRYDHILGRRQSGAVARSDFISGGTSWSRPVRLGGVQAQRAFRCGGFGKKSAARRQRSAAVPSAVDVYINGIKSYSKDVAAGPIRSTTFPANWARGRPSRHPGCLRSRDRPIRILL